MGRENSKKIGDKEDNLSLLSFDDFEKRGIAIDPNCTRLQALLAVTSLASVKLEEELKKPVESDEFYSFLVSREEKGKLLRDAMRSRRFSYKEDDEEWNAEHITKKKKKLKAEYYSSRLINNNIKRDKERVVNLVLPQNLKEFIEHNQNGTNIVLVIQKFLYATDISDNHNRLSIPVNQIREEFLTQEEKKDLDKAGSMEVNLIEPSLNIYKLVLKKWVMQKGYNGKKEKAKNSCSYVLIKEWNNVKLRNELKEGDEVQLWSFRNLENLCLALVVLRRRS